MGTQLPPGRGTAPSLSQFSAHVCCRPTQTARWINMPLGTEVGLGPDDIVLDGDPAPPPKGGTAPPPFSAHVYCGQTAGWIKMLLSTEVGLGPGNIVLDGAQLPPIFGPCLLCPNGRSPISAIADLVDNDVIIILILRYNGTRLSTRPVNFSVRRASGWEMNMG